MESLLGRKYPIFVNETDCIDLDSYGGLPRFKLMRGRKMLTILDPDMVEEILSLQ